MQASAKTFIKAILEIGVPQKSAFSRGNVEHFIFGAPQAQNDWIALVPR